MRRGCCLGTAALWGSSREAGGQAALLGCPRKGSHCPRRSFTSRLCLGLSPGCPWTPSGSWLSPGAVPKWQQGSHCTFPSRMPQLALHSRASPRAFLLYLRAHISQQQMILLWQAAGQPHSCLRYLGLKSLPALFGWSVLLSALRSWIKCTTEGLVGWFLPKAELVQSRLLLKYMLGRHALL